MPRTRDKQFPMKPLTATQMTKRREQRQAGYFDLLNDLHRAGFTRIVLESLQIGNDDYYITLMIGSDSLGSDQMDEILRVAQDHRARITLRKLDHSEESRIAVWLDRE